MSVSVCHAYVGGHRGHTRAGAQTAMGCLTRALGTDLRSFGEQHALLIAESSLQPQEINGFLKGVCVCVCVCVCVYVCV